MEKFLEEAAKAARPPARPATGQELAQQALIIAGTPARPPTENSQIRESPVSKTNASGKAVEPLSLEMYIAAFVQKLNRSANFIQKSQRIRGLHVGEVEIVLNSDGRLKNFRVLREGDQQAEINYIKSVIEIAAPFAAFPPDIKEKMDTLSVPICISPLFASEGGRAFSRSGTKDCAA